jgi:predicted GNAT family acetyltransferase
VYGSFSYRRNTFVIEILMANLVHAGIVRDNPAQQRFEMPVEGVLAVAYYRLDAEKVILIHTEVPHELSGQGIGSKLAEGTFSLIRASGRQAVLRCSFMGKWASRHPEVMDLIVG